MEIIRVAQQGSGIKMTYIEKKSINICLRYDMTQSEKNPLSILFTDEVPQHIHLFGISQPPLTYL